MRIDTIPYPLIEVINETTYHTHKDIESINLV